MIDWPLSIRRLALSLVAILVAFPLLRSSISSALVARGDSLILARESGAKEKYRLAVAIDPTNVDATDRLVFAAFLSRNSADLEDGVHLASLTLAKDPADATLRMDRAMCLQLLKQYGAARADFERVGKQRRDVQALALAAADARKVRDNTGARGLLLLAREIDPAYVPVRVALAKIRP